FGLGNLRCEQNARLGGDTGEFRDGEKLLACKGVRRIEPGAAAVLQQEFAGLSGARLGHAIGKSEGEQGPGMAGRSLAKLAARLLSPAPREIARLLRAARTVAPE